MVGFSRFFVIWRKWSLINKFAAVAAIITIASGLVQIVQWCALGYIIVSESINGAPPLSLPLKVIHKGMLEEIEYNIDCIESYRTLSNEPPEYEMCKTRERYIDSWFYHISAITSRDYYSDSTALLRDWRNIKELHAGLSRVSTEQELRDLESKSKLTLRDALFLTGYMRYFFVNFYEKKFDQECTDEAFSEKLSPRCKAEFMRLFGDMGDWQEQVDRWDGMSAKYALDQGKPVEDYPTWLALND
jgi:hypothetical protein